MMRLFLALFSFAVFVLPLTGCEREPLDYGFLMTHPDVLTREESRCEAMPAEDALCKVVRQAANDFSLLVNERAINPEGFGMRVLAAQTRLGELQQAVQPALPETRAAYDKQKQELAVLLAVIGATTNVST
jgi:hypothetical protein